VVHETLRVCGSFFFLLGVGGTYNAKRVLCSRCGLEYFHTLRLSALMWHGGWTIQNRCKVYSMCTNDLFSYGEIEGHVLHASL